MKDDPKKELLKQLRAQAEEIARNMSAKGLLGKLCEQAAKLDADDLNLIDESMHVAVLSVQVDVFRTELLTRMGAGEIEPADQSLLQGFVDEYVRTTNNGDEKPENSAEECEEMTARILTKASQSSSAKQLLQLA